MPTTYTDQFYQIDPSAPPAPGTVLTQQFLNAVDQNDNNFLSRNGNDSIDGSDITNVYPGDTITVVMNGATVTITGTTFYLADGRVLFTPTDGTNLDPATFVSSTFVTTQAAMPVGNLGPACFTPGTLIDVPGGRAAVETLVPGDLVETLDHGAQPLRWVGRREVAATGDFAPVRFAPGAIGNDRAMLVSPQHRVLVSGWLAELHFGRAEVLVAAHHLVGAQGVERCTMAKVSYIHLLFDRHEIVFSDGAPSESFHPGSILMDADTALYEEITAMFPELAEMRRTHPIRLARTELTGREARILRAA